MRFRRPIRMSEGELRSLDREPDRLLLAKRALERMTAQTSMSHCSRDLKYAFANSSYTDLLGKPVDRIVGQSTPEVLGETGFQVIRRYIERVRIPRHRRRHAASPPGCVPRPRRWSPSC